MSSSTRLSFSRTRSSMNAVSRSFSARERGSSALRCGQEGLSAEEVPRGVSSVLSGTSVLFVSTCCSALSRFGSSRATEFVLLLCLSALGSGFWCKGSQLFCAKCRPFVFEGLTDASQRDGDTYSAGTASGNDARLFEKARVPESGVVEAGAGGCSPDEPKVCS